MNFCEFCLLSAEEEEEEERGDSITYSDIKISHRQQRGIKQNKSNIHVCDLKRKYF